MARVDAQVAGWLVAACWMWKKRVLTLLEGLVGPGCPARPRLMDERVRNAYPLVMAGLVAPKMPKGQSCRAVRVLLATYTSPLIYTATLPKHTKNRDAVLPVAAAGGRPVSDAAVYAPKH